MLLGENIPCESAGKHEKDGNYFHCKKPEFLTITNPYHPLYIRQDLYNIEILERFHLRDKVAI